MSKYDFSGADIIGDLLSGADDDASGDLIGDIIGELMSGDDDASGDDASSLMALAGAMPDRRALAAAVRQATMRRAARGKFPRGARELQYRPRNYDKARVVPIGFDSVAAVPAGLQATITQRPQEPFRPARIIIPSDIAGAFLVNDVKVGNKSQLAANGSLPARMFQETAVGVNLLLDTADPAIDVVLIVTNFSGAPSRFLASIIGPAVDD